MTTIDLVESKTVTCTTQAGAPWVTNPLYTFLKLWNVWTRRGKDSVDDGVFIPGVYRINPYHVQSEQYYLPSHKIEHTYTSGSWWYMYKDDGPVGAKGFAVTCSALPAFDFGNLGEKALQNAYAKIAKNDVGMGENLGELRQTINMLRAPFQSLRDFLFAADLKNTRRLIQVIQYLKTGSWHGKYLLFGKNAATAAADTWLELRYGLMPLVYTVQDIIEMVNKQAVAFDATKIRSCRASQLGTDTYSRSYDWVYYKWNYHGEFIVEDTMKCTASVQFKQKEPLNTMELLGLTPRFIPELAWELTTASFVVDWWLSVGKWLGSLRFNPEIEELGNTVGYKGSRKVSANVSATLTWTGGSKRVTVPNAGSYSKEQYDRVVNQHLPLTPLLTLEWKSLLHTLDALALSIRPSLKMLASIRKTH